MAEQHITTSQLLERVLRIQANVRLTRPTLSKIVNDSYDGEPSAVIVRGLAQALDTTADYLLGLSEDRWPNATAFARHYSLGDEEQLLLWLAEQNAELAHIMRAIRKIPDEEQAVILQHLKNDIIFIRHMVAMRAPDYTLE